MSAKAGLKSQLKQLKYNNIHNNHKYYAPFCAPNDFFEHIKLSYLILLPNSRLTPYSVRIRNPDPNRDSMPTKKFFCILLFTLFTSVISHFIS